jgi:hypothetical protein
VTLKNGPADCHTDGLAKQKLYFKYQLHYYSTMPSLSRCYERLWTCCCPQMAWLYRCAKVKSTTMGTNPSAIDYNSGPSLCPHCDRTLANDEPSMHVHSHFSLFTLTFWKASRALKVMPRLTCAG